MSNIDHGLENEIADIDLDVQELEDRSQAVENAELAADAGGVCVCSTSCKCTSCSCVVWF